MKKGEILAIIPKMTPSYTISFEVQLSEISVNDSSVLQLATENTNPETCGNNILHGFFHKTGSNVQMLIGTSLSDDGSSYYFIYTPLDIPLNTWRKVEISQRKWKRPVYQQTVKVDGNVISTRITKNPFTITNVKIYSGSPFKDAAKANTRNIIVKTLLGRAFILSKLSFLYKPYAIVCI